MYFKGALFLHTLRSVINDDARELLRRLLTDPVRGLDRYKELFERLQNANGAIKIYCEVAGQ